MAITITDLVNQFGSYYIANESNMKRLASMIYKPSETAALFSARPGKDTVYRATMSVLNRIVQPFQKAFTPLGNITFKPNKIDLFKIKIDMQETPDDLEASYVGFLAEQEDHDRKNWLFVRWLLEVHVIPKTQEDLEFNEYFLGEYEAPVANTPGDPGTAMDGIRKQIRTYANAGRTNLGNGAIALGAVGAEPADVVTYLEEFAEAIPSHFRKRIDKICVSDEMLTEYRRGRRAKYGGLYNFLQSNELDVIEDYTSLKIVGLESMNGSKMVWATLPGNRIRPTKKASLKDTFRIESEKRVVNILSDWWEVLAFEVPEFIFHNDQDLA